MDFALPPIHTSHFPNLLQTTERETNPLAAQTTTTVEGFFKQATTTIEATAGIKNPVQTFFTPLLEAFTNIATPPTKPATQPAKTPNTRPKPTV